jgi:hypothetical protein
MAVSGASGAEPSGAGQAGAQPGVGGEPGVVDTRFGGLCSACFEDSDCGDDNDECLERDGAHFCGRDCDEWGGCPVGYDCSGSDGAAQCSPRTGDCIHLDFKPEPPEPAVLRAEAIDFVNDLRAGRGLYPLVEDECLSALAEESAFELALSEDFLGKFERECLDQSSCACGWAGESESSMAAYDLRWDDVVELPILDRLQEYPDDFQGTLFSDEFTRIGFGLALSGDEGFAAFSLGL